MFINFSPDKHHILRLYVEVDDARTMDERHGFHEAWREELWFIKDWQKNSVPVLSFLLYLALRLCESVVSPAAPAVDLLLRLNFVQTSSADFESVKIEQFLPAKKFTSGKIFCH